MTRIIITIDIEGDAAVNVSGPASAPRTAQDAPQGVDAALYWPEGTCPAHGRAWKDGNYGPYCTEKAEGTPANQRGYCNLRPGRAMMFQGRTIP